MVNFALGLFKALRMVFSGLEMATPTLMESITAMFNAIVEAVTNIVTAFAQWVSENAPLVAMLLGIGLLVGVVARYGRRIWTAIRGFLPF